MRVSAVPPSSMVARVTGASVGDGTGLAAVVVAGGVVSGAQPTSKNMKMASVAEATTETQRHGLIMRSL